MRLPLVRLTSLVLHSKTSSYCLARKGPQVSPDLLGPSQRPPRQRPNRSHKTEPTSSKANALQDRSCYFISYSDPPSFLINLFLHSSHRWSSPIWSDTSLRRTGPPAKLSRGSTTEPTAISPVERRHLFPTRSCVSSVLLATEGRARGGASRRPFLVYRPYSAKWHFFFSTLLLAIWYAPPSQFLKHEDYSFPGIFSSNLEETAAGNFNIFLDSVFIYSTGLPKLLWTTQGRTVYPTVLFGHYSPTTIHVRVWTPREAVFN